MTRQPSLKAKGNLTYLDFVRTLEYFWSLMHPDVPIVAAGASSDGRYPCIVYSMEVKTPFQNEPKPRYREEYVDEDNRAWIVTAQRFNCMVKFTVVAKSVDNGAHIAEQTMEAFEDFMEIQRGAFKLLGLSEITYNRRTPDQEDSRPGEGTLGRSVVYNVVIEKLLVLRAGVFERFAIEATRFLAGNQATPSPDDDDDDVDVSIIDNQASDLA